MFLLAAPATASWEAPERLPGAGWSPRPAINAAGDAAVLYTVPSGSPVGGAGLAVTYAPSGRGFLPPERVADHSPYFSDLVVSGDGDAFVIAEGGGGHQFAVRPAGGRFGPLETLPGVGRFADVAAGPRGEAVITGTLRDGGARIWRRSRRGRFTDTGVLIPTHTRVLATFAGERILLAWGDGRVRVAELRDGGLTEPQVVAQGSADGLEGTARGDALLRFSTVDPATRSIHRRTAHAPPGAPFAEVAPRTALAQDGTLAHRVGEDGPIEVRAPGAPPQLVEVPADMRPGPAMPFVSFNAESRIELFGAEPTAQFGPALTRFAQRRPDGSWCPSRLWDVRPLMGSGARTVAAGARGLAAWARNGTSDMFVTRYRPGDGCSPPLAAPRGLRASRSGTRLVVRWRAVEGAFRYRIRARLASGRLLRRESRSARPEALLAGVRRGARVTVTVRAVGRDDRAGSAATLRVPAR